MTSTSCEREPIHVPGFVQPFGVLMSVRADDATILQVSANAAELMGVPPDELLGKRVDEFLREHEGKSRFAAALASIEKPRNPYEIRLVAPGAHAERWLGFVHRRGDRWIVELEPAEERALTVRAFHQSVSGVMAAIQGAESVRALCEAVVDEVQFVSGYDRVMVYRFDGDWNGEVIAEARSSERVDSFLGHHFPASDIPPQAREIFRVNSIRMIADVDYRPSPLLPELDPETGVPLDLGHSFLRSVSPTHLHYLRNMRVKASLTLPLLSGERLWGLIACHHLEPRLLDLDARAACRFIGKFASALLPVKAAREDAGRIAELRRVNAALVELMSKSDGDLVDGLVGHSPNLLDMAGAEGAAAAVHLEGEWHLLGRTPSVEQIDRLVDWLNLRMAGRRSSRRTRCPSSCPRRPLTRIARPA